MKSIKIKGIIPLVIGMLFVLLGAFLKITKMSTDIFYNTLMIIGMITEIIAIYLLFGHLKSHSKIEKK